MARTTFSGPVVSQNGFEGPFTATQVVFQSTNANTITMDAPSALAASYTFLLPPNDGTNGQVLTTDGNGVTTWTTNGAGTVTSVAGTGTVNGLTLSGTVTSTGNITLGGTLDLSSPPAIGATAPAAGKFTNLTSTGNTAIGDAATDTVAFYGAAGVQQPTTGTSAAAFSAGTSGIVDDTATFGGYTIGQVVAALKNLGLLA